MKDLNINSVELANDPSYQIFLRENPGKGYLKIRASAANEALPISNVRIIVTKDIGNNHVTFFDGVTDSSGMINDITLPAPPQNTDDEVIPKFTEYEVEAIGSKENFDKEYDISVCCGITVIQYINVTPSNGVVNG